MGNQNLSMRPITAADEPLLASWWVGHGKPIIPAHLWPKRGFIVDERVAGFLFCTDGGLAIIEWIISRPEYDRVKRRRALKQLIALLTGTAMELGYKVTGVFSENSSVISLFKEDGWKPHFTKLTSLFREH